VGVWGGLLGVGIGVVVGVGIGVVGLMPPGSGFLGVGTGIGNGDSLGVGTGVEVGSDFGVDVGIGVGDGVPMGVVKPGEVILCAIAPGAATDRKLMEIVTIIGTKNDTKSVKIRLEAKLNLDMW
jgi:hypothetical protein